MVPTHTAPAKSTSIFSAYFGAFALASFGRPLVSAVLGISATLTLFGSLTLAAFAACVARVLWQQLRKVRATGAEYEQHEPVATREAPVHIRPDGVSSSVPRRFRG
jgi:hypothetical protein